MSTGNLTIRASGASDRKAIVALHRAAFGTSEGDEVATLADALQDDPTAEPRLSLIAEFRGEVVGHVLFTAVRVADGAGDVPGRILAPLGVSPDLQGRGVGSVLVREGLARLRRESVGLVFVLGHPGYYPRFGFETAGRLGFTAPYPIPDDVADAWMVQELNPGYIGRVKGPVHCCEVLDHPEHWLE